MKYQILRKETDISGKMRVWVDIGNGETQILKFSKEPIAVEVKTEVDRFITSKEIGKQKELEIIKEQIASLEERKKQLETEIK